MVCLEPSHCHDQARVNLLGNVIINIWHSLPLQWPVGSLCKFIARERNAHNEGCLLVLHWIELAGYGTASLKCHGRLIRQLTYCVRITAWHIPDIHHSLHFKSVMEVIDRPVSHGSISIRAAITSFWMDQDDASLAKLSSTTWRITFWTSVSQQSREAHTAQPYEGDVWILMRLTQERVVKRWAGPWQIMKSDWRLVATELVYLKLTPLRAVPEDELDATVQCDWTRSSSVISRQKNVRWSRPGAVVPRPNHEGGTAGCTGRQVLVGYLQMRAIWLVVQEAGMRFSK